MEPHYYRTDRFSFVGEVISVTSTYQPIGLAPNVGTGRGRDNVSLWVRYVIWLPAHFSSNVGRK